MFNKSKKQLNIFLFSVLFLALMFVYLHSMGSSSKTIFQLFSGCHDPIYTSWISQTSLNAGYEQTEAKFSDDQLESLLKSVYVKKAYFYSDISSMLPSPAIEIYINCENNFYNLVIAQNGYFSIATLGDVKGTRSFWKTSKDLFSILYEYHILSGGFPIIQSDTDSKS